MKPLFTVNAGEVLVDREIERQFRRVNIWIPARDRGIDLLVSDSNNKKTVSLQVKFSRDYLTAHMMRGALTCRTGPCPIIASRSNFHRVWDTALISKPAWSWGSYVDRLEEGRLTSADAKGADGGTFVDWAEGHKAAQTVWNVLPANRVLDYAYYQAVQPILDRQLGIAGLRLARVLNEAYESSVCPRPR